MSNFRKVDLGFGGQLDAANRLRVSQLFTLLDLKQHNDKQPLLYSEEINGGGTASYSSSEGGVVMTVNDASLTDFSIRQSKVWANYSAGKSQLAELTVSDFHPQSGVTKRVGLFTTNTTTPFDSNRDGIYIETANGGTHTLNIYKNGTQVHSTAQANWSIDTLGAGSLNPSGVTISGVNWRRFQVWVIDFLYLGGTSVRFGLLFNGGINWVHQYDHALNNDTIQSPMMLNPNLPVRYEIRATGEGVEGTMNQICAQVASEGATNSQIGVPISIDTGNTAITGAAAGTEHAVLGYRLKSGYKNVTTELQEVSGLVPSTAKNGILRVLLNPTVAGTFTYSDVTNTSIQKAVGTASNTITGGYQIDVLPLASAAVGSVAQQTILRIGSQIDGTVDEIVITWTPLAAGTTIVAGARINQLL